jgi:hypothetical protein
LTLSIGRSRVSCGSEWRARPIGNTFAYVALLAWPGVCIALFVALPIEAAAIWSLLGGYLLLPSGTQIDLPYLPPLDKMSIPAISAVLLCWMKGAQAPRPRHSILIYLLGLGYVVAPIFTSFGNSYELQTATGSVPGFYPLDGLKFAGRNLVMLAPFYIGSRFLCTEEGRSELLKSFPLAALFYSLPMLFEVRMSPQLHRWVYGFFPHSFAQQMRYGGFRPVVFLEQGLQVALFASMAVIAALVLVRAKRRILHVPAGAVAAYLSVILLLCKTLGAALYALVASPIILFMRPRSWVKIACALLLVVCAYPMLRSYGLIPVQQISNAANSISLDRSKSLETRITNEELLLAKAQQKPWFGWGTWGRNRVRDEYTGLDVSVTDGGWIIEFGTFGWLGYLSLFGLFAVAGFRALGAVGDQITPASVTIGGLSLLLAINVVDMIPNSNMTTMTLLLAGSMASAARVRATRQSRSASTRSKVPGPSPATAAQ